MASRQPDALACTFVTGGADPGESLTFGELDRRARAFGAYLQQRGWRGKSVILLFPPGLDFVASFRGCLYGGCVAVPAYPPASRALARSIERLQRIAADAGAVAVLAAPALRDAAEELFRVAPSLGLVEWVVPDQVPDSLAEAWRDPGAEHDSVAYLQYTSGSTGSPKGVVVTHGNLLHQAAVFTHGSEFSPGSVSACWLPPYHDMGLVLGILQPLFSGIPAYLMAPLTFLQRPLNWLELISTRRVTHTGGPNFAYELCVRSTTPEERATLDLGSWEVAYNGAEPVRWETLRRFAEAFAPSGFRWNATYPGYGLAESTLLVSGGFRLDPPVS